MTRRRVISRPNPNFKNELLRILVESDLKKPLVTIRMNTIHGCKGVWGMRRAHFPKAWRKTRQRHFIMFYLSLDLVGCGIPLVFNVDAKSVSLAWTWIY